DGTEGARTHNVVGSYLHGPVLPANPWLADGLLEIAARRATGSWEPGQVDDSIARQAHDHQVRRLLGCPAPERRQHASTCPDRARHTSPRGVGQGRRPSALARRPVRDHQVAIAARPNGTTTR